MNLRPEDLAGHLERKLAPLYVVHGDEPLLALEAADQVRAAARRSGIVERDVLVVEQGFKWGAFLAAQSNLGLFGDRRLIDLRIPSGKPGVEGAKALEAYADSPPPDTVTLVSLPRLDRATQDSAWFSALARAGVTIGVQPVEREALPRWIGERLARQKQRAGAETLAFLADLSEGNLIAARQEIEKLALVLPEGELDQAAVESAVADVARYDVFAASEAWLAGDAARAIRVLASVEAAGEGPQLAIWSLGEDLHALAAVQSTMAAGTPLSAALRNARAWGKRQAALERAVRRVRADDVVRWLAELAAIDALSKGIGTGDAWLELQRLALAVAGKPVGPAAGAGSAALG
jgi:DNA polymerase-3 subunit delta